LFHQASDKRLVQACRIEKTLNLRGRQTGNPARTERSHPADRSKGIQQRKTARGCSAKISRGDWGKEKKGFGRTDQHLVPERKEPQGTGSKGIVIITVT
jgi:hypothetical protein